MQDDYIQPTPASRLRAALPLLYAPLLWFLDAINGKYVRGQPLCDSAPWLRLEIVVILLMLVAPGAYFLLRGWRTLRHGQFPAPGTPVFFRRRIQRGWLARIQGIGLLAFAAAFIGTAAYGTWYFDVGALLFQPCVPDAGSALAACREALAPRH